MLSQSQALMNAIKEYENNKWKVIGQKVGKPAKVHISISQHQCALSFSSVKPAKTNNSTTRPASNMPRSTFPISFPAPRADKVAIPCKVTILGLSTNPHNFNLETAQRLSVYSYLFGAQRQQAMRHTPSD